MNCLTLCIFIQDMFWLLIIWNLNTNFEERQSVMLVNIYYGMLFITFSSRSLNMQKNACYCGISTPYLYMAEVLFACSYIRSCVLIFKTWSKRVKVAKENPEERTNLIQAYSPSETDKNIIRHKVRYKKHN